MYTNQPIQSIIPLENDTCNHTLENIYFSTKYINRQCVNTI